VRTAAAAPNGRRVAAARPAALLPLAAAWLLLAPAVALGQIDSLEMNKRRELEEIQRQARETREAAQRLKTQETSEIGRLRRTERDLGSTQRRLRNLNRRQDELDENLLETRVRLDRSQQALEKQRRLLGRRLRNLYKFGPGGEVEFLLSTASFAQLLARWDFLVRIARQDQELLDALEQRRTDVEANAQRLTATIDQVERNLGVTERERRRLASLRVERQQTVGRIQTQRKAYESAAAELEKTARSIQRLLAQLERQRKAEEEARKRGEAPGRQPAPYTGDFARGQGALDWPVQGDLIGRFGPEEHPRFKTKTMNNGVDISAPIGTTVRSVAKGRVDFTSEDYGTYGQLVILNHGDGYYTLYAHLSEILVRVGNEVQSGQTIGRVGDTGSLKGNVLHFEVRRGATALDPEDWLR
jgi:septal ring factor EnvC (AmiA/AmiB activator)